MKKMILIIALVIAGLPYCFSHEYIPLVREGVKWECTNYLIWWGNIKDSPYTIELKGDTIFNDHKYKKCLFVSEGDTTLHALLREDIEKQQVYMHFIPDPKEKYHFTYDDTQYYDMMYSYHEILLYDFLQPERILYFELNEIKNENIFIEDTIIGGQKRTQIRIVDDNENPRFSIIEGIGFEGESALNVDGYFDGCLIDYSFIDETPNGCYDFSVFHRFIAEDGIVIYEAPNGNGGVEAIDAGGGGIVEVARYDVHGRRLSKPVPGINIVRMSDGTIRKVIERKL